MTPQESALIEERIARETRQHYLRLAQTALHCARHWVMHYCRAVWYRDLARGSAS